MIKSAVISNFQSHKHTELEFHRGFNSIVGTTDSGKSAIYRALFWLKSNKATNFISFWNRKKDGTPIDPTQVKIEKEGHSISRIRTSSMNGYDVDGIVLEAIGRGEPPEQVTTALNMSDINFFSQHHPPFLLTKSPGEVASILNELIHLDDIDRVLGNINEIKLSTKKNLKQEIEKVAQLSKTIGSYAWLDSAKELLDRAESIEKDMISVDATIKQLDPCIIAYESNEELIQQHKTLVGKAAPLLLKLDSIQTELEEVVQKFAELDRVITSIDKIEASIASLKKIDATENIKECDAVVNELNAVSEELDDIVEWLEKYAQKERAIAELKQELAPWQEQLSAIPVCAECGRPMEECDDGD